MKTVICRTFAVLIAALAFVGASAQTSKFKYGDDYLVGTWVLESIQYEGMQKTSTRGDSYAQIKIYRKDGEYACVQMYVEGGKLIISPHEYGTYTFKNGTYTEMGRTVAKDGLVPVNKNTFKGRWKNRHDEWSRIKLPEKVVTHILERCRAKEVPEDIKKIIIETLF